MSAWRDTVAFHNKTLMDDTVLVEPDLGIRPAMSSLRARQSLVRIFGGEAINEKKFLEEGSFATRMVVWGMEYDTDNELLRYPEPKIHKLKAIVSDPQYDWGCKEATLQ